MFSFDQFLCMKLFFQRKKTEKLCCVCEKFDNGNYSSKIETEKHGSNNIGGDQIRASDFWRLLNTQ